MAEIFEGDILKIDGGSQIEKATGDPAAPGTSIPGIKTSAGFGVFSIGNVHIDTVAPGLTDDASKGYVAGVSFWFKTTPTKTFYVCTNAAVGSAMWERFLISGASLASPGKYFDWDQAPSQPPPEDESGDILVFKFQNGGPIRSVIGGIQYPVGVAPTVNPVFTIPFAVTTTGAGDADVLFRLHAKYIANGELTTKADDETLDVVTTVVDVMDEKGFMTFTLDKDLIAAADYCSFKLERIHGDAADTYTGEIGIFEISEFDPGT